MILDLAQSRKQLAWENYAKTYAAHRLILREYNTLSHEERTACQKSQQRLEKARDSWVKSL